MLVSDWPNAIAHVDADCFYASCELARRPELRCKPVCVLSSHDACVVAKTYDARAAGITTGMPVWEARKRLPTAEYLSADFPYYGQMSERMFAILGRYSPEIEVYSIDEGFIGMNGLRSLWRKSFEEIATIIRDDIRGQLGITVSIGIGVTKTLAKIASDFNKPDGTTLVSGRQIATFLAQVKVRDIPGIGRNRDALLEKSGIRSALELTEMPQAAVKRLLGKHGVDLWHELRGIPMLPLELVPRLPKTIARTASMGEISDDRELLSAHLTRHTMRLALELVRKRYLAGRLTVFLTQKNFGNVSVDIRLPQPTGNYFMFSGPVRQALEALFQPGRQYRGCGVIASGIEADTGRSFDMFADIREDERQGRLLKAMDAINARYGSDTVRMMATMRLAHGGRSKPRLFRHVSLSLPLK